MDAERATGAVWGRIAGLCLVLLGGLLAQEDCSAGTRLTTAPVKWFDADNKTIPMPVKIEENRIWDIIDLTFFHQVGKLLDLGWTARRAGNLLNVAPARQADNINALDEVPGSSWYTNRHFLHPMTVEELMRGPGIARPDTIGPWEIVAGKLEGKAPGFAIVDATGAKFVLKFDAMHSGEMATSAEVISTSILHAAGYNVPENAIVYFDPAILRVGSDAEFPDGRGGKRPMVEADMHDILSRIAVRPDGRIRCVASKYPDGIQVGVFDFHSRRRDDPNDRVKHQHRRELRGLRVISSWINDVDRCAANTLCMYVTGASGRRYIRHYLVDMGATLGSSTVKPRSPRSGNEYIWDPRTVGLSLLGAGLYRKAWEQPLPMKYSCLGYLESEVFHPGRWVTDYPNPAFQRCTNRDGYWGAKIVMSFSDEDIAAIVGTGRLSDPGAEAELARLLTERRDKIGRHWFARINPLDLFRFHGGGTLRFEDLGRKGNAASASTTTYRYRLLNARGKAVGPERTLQGRTSISLEPNLKPERFYGYEIRTRRPGRLSWSKYTRVYFYVWQPGRYQIVRIEREE